jgi:hypothetical protein
MRDYWLINPIWMSKWHLKPKYTFMLSDILYLKTADVDKLISHLKITKRTAKRWLEVLKNNEHCKALLDKKGIKI